MKSYAWATKGRDGVHLRNRHHVLVVERQVPQRGRGVVPRSASQCTSLAVHRRPHIHRADMSLSEVRPLERRPANVNEEHVMAVDDDPFESTKPCMRTPRGWCGCTGGAPLDVLFGVCLGEAANT